MKHIIKTGRPGKNSQLPAFEQIRPGRANTAPHSWVWAGPAQPGPAQAAPGSAAVLAPSQEVHQALSWQGWASSRQSLLVHASQGDVLALGGTMQPGPVPREVAVARSYHRQPGLGVAT